MGSIRVLVVDGQRAFAQALSVRLAMEPRLTVVGNATSGASAPTEVEVLGPDVVVLDGSLNRDGGVALVRRLRAEHPDVRIVVLAAVENVRHACDAIRAGASAIVMRDAGISEVIRAIEGSVRGESWMPPHLLTGVLLELQAVSKRAEHDPIDSLTPREREVLRCMMEGLNRASIARRLMLSVNTVRTHTQNLLVKLEVHTSIEAVSVAARLGSRDPNAGTLRQQIDALVLEDAPRARVHRATW